MEIMIAIGAFAIVAVALVSLLNQVVNLSIESRETAAIQRVVQSELISAMTMPNLEEGETSRQIEEREIELTTLIAPLELENEEGEAILSLFEVTVTARWLQDGERQEVEASSWRNLRMYQE